jgi:hypothetical protein
MAQEVHFLEIQTIVTCVSGWNKLFYCSVQAQVIPWLLAAHSAQTQYWPHDVCVSAPTGSGKTLAFVIPIVQVITVGNDVKIFVALYNLQFSQNFCDPVKFTLLLSKYI